MRRGFSIFDIVGILTVAVWLFLMVKLLSDEAAPTAENRLEITAEEAAAGFRAGEEWRGLYHRGDKVGFVQISKRILDDGFEITLHQVMRLSLLGQEQSIDLSVRTEADDDFVLRSFNGSLEASGARFEAAGRVERLSNGRFRVHFELTTPEAVHTDFIDLAEPPLVEHDIARALLSRQPQPGDTYEMRFFDPMTQRLQPVVVEYVGREPLPVIGQTIWAHHLIQHVSGQSLDRWVNDLGEVLREQLPLDLVAERESRAEAMYGVIRREGSAPAIDLARAARIPVQLDGLDLERAARASWRLTGVDPLRFELAGGRQALRPTPDGSLVLRLLREPLDRGLRVDDLVIDRDLAEYLTPEPFIQSDHPAIVARSERIAARLRGVSDTAEAVNRWVFENLERVAVVAVPSAVDVLATRRGDCNEHATLATALLRAAGVPARVAVGVAHRDDAFYYHAWVEYWHDGWRTMDPTWGQFPADLGHIRLLSGGLERQVDLIELFDGAVRIDPVQGGLNQ